MDIEGETAEVSEHAEAVDAVEATASYQVSISSKATASAVPITVYWVTVDPTTGAIKQQGHTPASNAEMVLKAQGAVEISAEQFAQVRRGRGQLALVNGAIVPLPAKAADPTQLRRTWLAKLDVAAEKARANFMPSGGAHAIEYMAALFEAKQVTAAADPLDAVNYPWLSADVAAAKAKGTTLTLRDAAAAVLKANTAWETAAVAIRQARTTAANAIAQATTPAQMQLIVSAIRWP